MSTFMSNVSSTFTGLKRQFYRIVENVMQPLKRPFIELGEDDHVITSYAPVRKKKKNCCGRDEPFHPMTRTLYFTPTHRYKSLKRSPLKPIPEDEPPQSRVKVDTGEERITGIRKQNCSSASACSPRTPVLLKDQDAAPATPRRIIPPVLKTYSKQKLNGGSSKLNGGRNEKKRQTRMDMFAKGTSEFQPRKYFSVNNHIHKMRHTNPVNSSSKKSKSGGLEESYRIEDKKQYQQLLEHCTSDPSDLSPTFSRSVSQASSRSSNTTSPFPSPEVMLPKKISPFIHQGARSENVPPTPSLRRILHPSKPNVSAYKKKDDSKDQRTYSDHYKDLEIFTPHSGATIIKNASDNTYSRVDSVIKSKKWLKSHEEGTLLPHLTRLHKEREDNPIPLIDLADSDTESVQSHTTSSSDSDSVEIVDEFPHGRKRAHFLKSKIEREQMKYRQCKYGSLMQGTDTKDSEAENEFETRKRISHNLYSKVENRMKCLDIISDSEIRRGSQKIKIKPPFGLTPKMRAEIDDALDPVPKSEVLVNRFNLKITRRDIQTLNGLNWLNDQIINFYLSLIVERSQGNKKLRSVYAVNTFFYPKLRNHGYQSVSRWTKKVDIFMYDILLVPIHLGVHWCMATVDFNEKSISYYDSMLGDNDKCLQILLNYLELEHLDKKNTPYRTVAWKLENVKDIPEQMNGSDCGVFACQFAEHKSREAPMDFDQGDMPYFRKRMVYEITNEVLLD